MEEFQVAKTRKKSIKKLSKNFHAFVKAFEAWQNNFWNSSKVEFNTDLII